jgi:hypothetical protein
MTRRKCKICGKQALGRELCSTHYSQLYRAGKIESAKPIQIQHVPFDQCYLVRPSGCWEWQRAILKTGYGFYTKDNRKWRAHRYSYTINIGPIPAGLDVMHSCDNRKCVNPAHLSVGTRLQNMRDALARGRTPRGEKHPGAKLNRKDAARIRLLCETMTQKAVAEVFGVDPSTVCAVVNRYKRGGWL